MDVPFATRDGAIINWIESKALFGDDAHHEKYSHDQLRPYVNRFGTGLVIYWFGFITDLRVSSLKEGFVIEEAFPADDQIILMNPGQDMYEELPLDQGSIENSENHFLNIRTESSNHETTDSITDSAIVKVAKSIENTRIE